MSHSARLNHSPTPTPTPSVRGEDGSARGRRGGLTLVEGGRSPRARFMRDASVDLVPDSRAGEWADDRAPRSPGLARLVVDDEAGCETCESLTRR